ncbi:DUF4011 domain-containing protein [Pararhizobium sp. O133]|uniref:DUF4011 domain-containing protein n=1 Tax=Pararhizobium sp. O133 TaxID=3449278 RepID=UPI003F684FF3
MNGQSNPTVRDFSKLVASKIEEIRPRLLDLTSRNPLVNMSFDSRSASQVRVIDELPDRVFYSLNNDTTLKFRPLPSFEEESKDELTTEFVEAVSIALRTDDEYLSETRKLDTEAADYPDLLRRAERALRDRVRAARGMPRRITRKDESLAQHARNNGIDPSFDLPLRETEAEDDRYDDDHIQTLLLGADLERKLNALMTKSRTAQQETGLNLLRGAFGFLEWKDPARADDRVYLSPLVLSPVLVQRKKSAGGPIFSVEGTGEEAETNLVLLEKFKREFGIDFPPFSGGSLEDYFEEIGEIKHAKLPWKVRRRITFSVFPAARMAMYEDLNTAVSNFSRNEIIQSILVGAEGSEAGAVAEEYEVDAPDVEAEVPHLVKKADASQFSVLVDVARGRNIAVEGPPGTGKSDTIVNAIATALSKGKKVLFVAEKSAALEVVRSRLEAVGLGDFVLPLLAGKSSKDEFMRSIRDRMELREQSPRGLDEARERFVDVRDKLSRYVSILSSEWEGTEETVHRILGRAIATQHFLDGMSALALSEHSIPAREFRADEFETMNSSIGLLAELSLAAACRRTHWRGTACLETSQFRSSAILASAHRASRAFAKLATTTADLRGFGLDERLTVADISAIKGLADYIRGLVEGELSPDEVRIATFDAPEDLRTFVQDCGNVQDSAKSLGQILIDPAEPNTRGRLERINEICRSTGVRSLDPAERSSQIAGIETSVAVLSKSVLAAGEFVAHHPPASRWSVGAADKVAMLVRDVPKAVLALRSPGLADASSVARLKEFVEVGRELRARRSELERVVDLRPGTRSADIDRHLSVIKGSGALSFLSSTYKEAKRFYVSVARSGSFDKSTALDVLERARNQLEEEDKFETRAIRSAVFGSHFEGVQTSFDTFAQLAEFYDHVDREFGGYSNRDVRDFVCNAPMAVLQEIPDFPEISRETLLGEIEAAREKLKADLGKMRSIDNELTQLCRVFSVSAKVTPSALPALIGQVEFFHNSLSELDASPVAQVLGEFFEGWKSNPSEFEYLIEVAELLQGYRFGAAFALAAEQRRLQALLTLADASYADAQDAHVLIDKVETESSTPVSEKLADLSFEQASHFLAEAAEDHDALEHWIGVARARTAINRLGMLQTVDLLECQLGRPDVAGHAEALMRRNSAGRVYEKFGRELVGYSGRDIEGLRHQLKKLDDEITLLSRKALRYQLIRNPSPPNGVTRGRVAELTEMGLLEHLSGQKKIRVPVREITRRASRALLALKPCWMMSPLAVAQYIQKNTLEFDVCIIDEASQMPPEDAIGALFRSRQAMIVGDTQQLPPSNFFHKSISDAADDEETDAVTEESVLEMANTAFRPRRMLTWHYRSKHSGLIKFSNNIIYQDRLTVFPSAHEDNPTMGVGLVNTNGLYKAGVNTTEAHAVVEAALEFMSSDSSRSLGIVAVNKAQADYINERLQYEIPRHKAASEYVDRWLLERDGLEEFFVKNLENVQGDERDVIFVSTVYGPPTEGGKVAQHFGPIAGPTGRRRLNVLFTRAKEQIRTFTSMSPSDITAEKETNAGAWMLKRWLEYSAGGPLEAGTGTYGAYDSPLEEYIATQIQAMGCEAVPQVGAAGYSIDLGVRHPQWPNGFLMGVECDGATYHSSRSARDRDRHRQEILENLGWTIHRVWSTDWFDNPRREAERLRTAIAARLEHLKTKLARMPPAPTSAVDLQPPFSPSNASPRTAEPGEQLTLLVEATSPPAPRAATSTQRRKSVRLGSKVRLRYLDRGMETYQFTIIKDPSAPERGLVNQSAPLAKAVLDAEAGDEIEVLLGSSIRKAVVETVE